jgi:hypothetical protein
MHSKFCVSVRHLLLALAVLVPSPGEALDIGPPAPPRYSSEAMVSTVRDTHVFIHAGIDRSCTAHREYDGGIF